MTTSTDRAALDAQRRHRIEQYFRYIDGRDARLPTLFTEDVEVWFPKLGSGRGFAHFTLLASRIGIAEIVHDVGSLRYVVAGDAVVVEGTERGRTVEGVAFPDGDVSQGRFCTVFDFDGLLISRVSIYLDPDFASADVVRVEQFRGTTVA